MKRAIAGVTVGLVAAIVFLPAPANAIINGVIDGDRHPSVAALIGTTPSGDIVRLCTGQLVSSTAIITSGGCTQDFLAAGGPVLVSFEGRLPRNVFSIQLRTTRMVTDPDYNPTNYFHDLGVVVLPEAIGIRPIQLPTLGLLDQVRASGHLSEQAFTTAGYGVTSDCSSGPCAYDFDGYRRLASERVIALSGGDININMNTAATSQGGFCFGDNGGPHFLGSTNVSVAVSLSVNERRCEAIGFATRLDTPIARRFLGRFVALP